MNMLVEPQKVIDTIRYVAETEVMPRFKNLKDGDIREKNPGDFVTIADEESEKAFSSLLPELLAGSLVVGEEAVSKDIAVLQELKKDHPVWVIDPIDGTYNYKTGNDHFGILISLVRGGETLMGFCYDAPKDECFYAVKGQGAFYEDGGIIAFPHAKQTGKIDVAQMYGLVGGAKPWHFDKLNNHIADFSNIRCSLHNTLHLMKGKGDFVLWHNVTPWDNAGCTLLVQELGGYIAYADGTEYSPMDPPQRKFLLATIGKSEWNNVSAMIAKSGIKNIELE